MSIDLLIYYYNLLIITVTLLADVPAWTICSVLIFNSAETFSLLSTALQHIYI